MGNVEFKLNREGVRELLKSQEMMNICSDYANNAQGRLGEGYEVTTMTGKNRVNAEVRAVSYKARKENNRDNTILKAVLG